MTEGCDGEKDQAFGTGEYYIEMYMYDSHISWVYICYGYRGILDIQLGVKTKQKKERI